MKHPPDKPLHIAALRVVERRGVRRVIVELDNGSHFELDPELVVQHQLQSGREIDPERIVRLEQDDAILWARRRLLRYLAMRVKSVAEARRYLEKAEFSGAVIDAAIKYALERDQLNDRRFAEKFVRTRLRAGIYGPVRLLAELVSHGIDGALAEEVLAPQFDFDNQREAAGELARKWAGRPTSPDDDRAKKKLYDYLQRRGFQAEVAHDVTERFS